MSEFLEEVKKSNKKSRKFAQPMWDDILLDYKEKIPIYFDKAKLFWLWDYNNKKWEYVDETQIKLLIQDNFTGVDMTNSSTDGKISKAIKLVGRRRNLKDPVNEWIQFKNKTININLNKEIEMDNSFFFVNPIPWDVSDSDDTPIMDSLIESWVGKDYLQTMYQIIGYCIYRNYPIHRIFCFTGSGRNGKSQFLKIVNKFLGDTNTCSTDLDLLMTRPFESFKLYKKLVCQMGETNYEGMKRTAILKSLSGGDLISYEQKGKDGFTDYNYAKLLISTNGIPITHDKSDGFYRRWFIIDFPNNFPEGKDIFETIPDKEYNNLCRKCINLLPKLIKNGKFTNEPSIEEKKRIYEEKSNPLMLFLKNKTNRDYDSYIPKYEFKDKFKLWMNDNGYRPLPDSEINTLMKDQCEEVRKVPFGKDNPIWCWLGLSWTIVKIVRIATQTQSVNSFPMRNKINDNPGNPDKSFSISKSIISILETIEKLSETKLLKIVKSFTTEEFEYLDFVDALDKLSSNGDIMKVGEEWILNK